MTNTNTMPAPADITTTPIAPGILDDDFTVSIGGNVTMTAALAADGVIELVITTPTRTIEHFIPTRSVTL